MISFNPEDVCESKGPKESVKVPQVRKFIRIVVVDVREGSGSKKQFELEGFMEVPVSVYFGQVIVNWRFEELKYPMKGNALDVQAEGVTILFPLVHPDNTLAAKGTYRLTFDEIRNIFIETHPYLKLTRKV